MLHLDVSGWLLLSYKYKLLKVFARRKYVEYKSVILPNILTGVDKMKKHDIVEFIVFLQ